MTDSQTDGQPDNQIDRQTHQLVRDMGRSGFRVGANGQPSSADCASDGSLAGTGLCSGVLTAVGD